MPNSKRFINKKEKGYDCWVLEGSLSKGELSGKLCTKESATDDKCVNCVYRYREDA